ncbi:T9SS type B sorting domain-containing protein [Dyadobacter bucti]|uniref:T9SS type B sorting domain-containing protein n=1 Tax=Dyadobacter bucti TaxID=2572203 RepID=UPI001108CBD3|nr:gliding motility-associated C-terminal domain-containing protein [Dyadobacter bucti]
MKIRLLLLFLLSVLLPFQKKAFAQFCGNTGGFTVTPSEGCAPLSVEIKNEVTGAENISYVYDFDRNQTTAPLPGQATQDVTFTYSDPGTYTILQFGSAGGTGFSQCKDIVVNETKAPKGELVNCGNGLSRVTLIDDKIAAGYDFIIVDWGDGTSAKVSLKNGDPLSVEHLYANGNNNGRNVTISGGYTDGRCQTSITKTPLTPVNAALALKDIRIRSLENFPNGDIKVIYDGKEGTPTEILIDKGDGQFVRTGKISQVGGAQSATFTDLTPGQIYRVALSSKDICGNAITSPVVSSITIKEEPSSRDEIIAVSWEDGQNSDLVLQYQLKRDGVVIYSSGYDQKSYLDTDVKCGNTYKYEVVTIIANDVRSYSAPVEIKPKTASPETISRASVTVKDDNTIVTQVELAGEGLTSSYNLIVERAPLGSTDFQQVSPAGNQTLVFEDPGVNTGQSSYCYRFQYENACNLKAPDFSPPVCSILLASNTQDVFWNADSPFTTGISSYDLIQMDENGNLQDELPKQLNTSHRLDLGTQTAFSFQVKAFSMDGNLSSFSNTINFKRDAIILIPDAFTPNGDAFNERFEVKAHFVSDFQMSVYNRWGEVVFHSEDINNGWDGNINDGKAPGGYYLYKIKMKDSYGQTVSRNGSFLLIR